MEPTARRLHICLGINCNNNCLFCMEEDRKGRESRLARIDTGTALRIMERADTRREIMFTAGEPTLRPDLPELIAAAASLGYERIGLISNGRRFAYADYAGKLVAAGLNHLLVSVHGHTAALHDGLTRTPGSFDQAVAGLRNLARLRAKRGGSFRLICTTVLNRRNMDTVPEHVRFLRSFGPDEIVLNAIQPLGRGETHLKRLVPSYHELVSSFSRGLGELDGPLDDLFLLDVPRCMTTGLPQEVLGFVEEHAHFEPEEEVLEGLDSSGERMAEERGHGGLRLVEKGQLDGVLRVKGRDCPDCLFFARCEGVWKAYVDEYGFDEFRPVGFDAGENI